MHDDPRTTSSPAATRRGLLLGTAGALLAAPALRAQSWPDDRVTIVVSLPAGLTTALTARLYADQLSRFWGQPVIIDNSGRANGALAAQAVARARPDGRTLLATTAMTHAANPWLIQRLPYGPVADCEAVAMWSASPFVMMATKGFGTPTLAALTDRLRAKPGRHNFASGTVPGRIVGELCRQLTGVDVVHVGHRGNPAACPDITQGRVSFMPVDIQAAKPLVDRGAVDALAVTDAEPHCALPAVPTAAAAGLPGLRFITWGGLYPPKGTPAHIVERTHADMVRAYLVPEVNARILANGGSRVPPMGPAAFTQHTIDELATWGRIIRQAGLTLD
jgi:tripartite-type tricarboxylate transporter receptor subunit TctC